jgi:hypothetical protein
MTELSVRCGRVPALVDPPQAAYGRRVVTPELDQGAAAFREPTRGSRWARWALRVGASALAVMGAVVAFYDLGRILWGIQNWNNTSWEFLPEFEVLFGLVFILPLAAIMVGLAVVAYRGTGWWAITSLVSGGLLALVIGAWLRGNHADAHQVFLVIAVIALLSPVPRVVERTWDQVRARSRR